MIQNKKIEETEYSKMEIREGIFYGSHKANVEINLAIAKKILEDRIVYCEGYSFPSLVYDEGLHSIDKPAREYLSSIKGCEGLKAIAIVTNRSFYFRVMASFIMKVTTQPVPVKIFEEERAPLIWLEKYK